MLIYANAVTQIWKRLVPSVGSWTEAWNSHVALRAWGNLQPTDSTCTFLLLMFTARWSLEITGIFFFCLCFIISTCSLFFHNGGSKSSWIWDHERWTQFRSVSGIYRGCKTPSLALLESAQVLFLVVVFFILFFSLTFFFFAVSHCSLLKLEATVASYTTLIHSVM